LIKIFTNIKGGSKMATTNEPKFVQKNSFPQTYVKNAWELIDKYILSKKTLPFVIVIILLGFIIIQDNGIGKLNNWEEIWWTIRKCVTLIVLFIIIEFVQWFYQKIIK
jgi:hypothetical protein